MGFFSVNEFLSLFKNLFFQGVISVNVNKIVAVGFLSAVVSSSWFRESFSENFDFRQGFKQTEKSGFGLGADNNDDFLRG